jgi:hypothetical protein
MLNGTRIVINPEGGLLTVNNPSSPNLDYLPLDTSDNSYNLMAAIFNSGNSNVAFYANGDSANPEAIQNKVDFWGHRYETNNPLSCYVVFEKGSSAPIGIVNFGHSRAVHNDQKLYAGGFLFSDSYSDSPLVTEALNSVYVTYAQDLYNQGILSSPAFIYTMSLNNPLITALQDSELSQIDLTVESSIQNCLIAEITANNDHFNFDYDTAVITDNVWYDNREIGVFYYLYDDLNCEQ